MAVKIVMMAAAMRQLNRSTCFRQVRHFTVGQQPLMMQMSPVVLRADRMRQVDVDEPSVQKQLGNINMDFVRKAEKRNTERATMHRFFRRKDWMIATACFAIVIGIYGYTIFAIKQEKFLDDFDMPEEIDRTKK